MIQIYPSCKQEIISTRYWKQNKMWILFYDHTMKKS